MKFARPSAVVCAILCALALASAQAEARTPASQPRARTHSGFMLGGALGFGEANFDLEASNDESDVGLGGVFDIGYGFSNGLALTLDVSVLSYEYYAEFLGSSFRYSLNLDMQALSLWYIFDLNQEWRGYVRGGIGTTSAEIDFIFSDKGSSSGYLLGGGAYWYFNPEVALWLELFVRSYGITFRHEDFEQEEIQVFGLNVGILWL
jgi:opacity protein-like surface antigen